MGQAKAMQDKPTQDNAITYKTRRFTRIQDTTIQHNTRQYNTT